MALTSFCGRSLSFGEVESHWVTVFTGQRIATRAKIQMLTQLIVQAQVDDKIVQALPTKTIASRSLSESNLAAKWDKIRMLNLKLSTLISNSTKWAIQVSQLILHIKQRVASLNLIWTFCFVDMGGIMGQGNFNNRSMQM